MIAIQQYWLLLVVSGALYLLVITLNAAFHANNESPEKRRLAERKARVSLFGIASVSSIALFLYSYAPRTQLLGSTPGSTIVISKFAGPKLPAPYEDCRPSEELVHALTDVADRYGWLHVNEVPWGVDPNTRWSNSWAKTHGWFEAADVIVYGDYGFATSGSNGEANAIIINPRADAVPRLPIADNLPPLYSWEFTRSKVSIAGLCSGSVAAKSIGDAGDGENFTDDIRRLALSIVAAELFAAQDYLGAQRALSEAKGPPGSCKRQSRTNSCHGGVLNYYLANLDVRFGNFSEAKAEYEKANTELASSPPHLSLAELDFRLGDKEQGFNELSRAVWADPTSVAARATKSLYERAYFDPHKAAIDLDRALNMKPTSVYDLSALSRALYDREKACGITVLSKAVHSRDFDPRTMLETYVRYGIWLYKADKGADARKTFVSALKISPDNIKANYWLGMELKNKNPQTPEAEAFFRRALYAPGFTDEDFLTQGDAAVELRNFAKRRRENATEARRDEQDEKILEHLAIRDYKQSIKTNINAVNAYKNLGLLEIDLGNRHDADQYLGAASRLRPFDHEVTDPYVKNLKELKRSAEADRWRESHKTPLRIAPEERWSNCRYTPMNLNSASPLPALTKGDG